MPASSTAVVMILVTLALPGSTHTSLQPLSTINSEGSSALRSAVQWLASNQSSTGSYGDYREHWAAAAAFAMWLNDSNSAKAALSYSWLAARLNDNSSWFWGQYGEADVPGASLYSIMASQNLALINVAKVSSQLQTLQERNWGFRGYYDPMAGSVTSSADTAMALLGLLGGGELNNTSQQGAVEYLLSLHNADGSFNLTETVPDDPLYSLAPEPMSLTALSLLSLRNASSYVASDTQVAASLDFLNQVVSSNLLGSNGKDHVYAASLAALALNAFGRTTDASRAVAFILLHQNPDGGFADSSRSSSASNALDTGWAAIAIQSVRAEQAPSQPATSWLAPWVIAAVVTSLAAIALIIAVAFQSRRRKVQQY